MYVPSAISARSCSPNVRLALATQRSGEMNVASSSWTISVPFSAAGVSGAAAIMTPVTSVSDRMIFIMDGTDK